MKTKVYIVRETHDDSSAIRGIYATRAKALAAINDRLDENPERNDLDIVEMPMNEWRQQHV